MWKVLAVTVLCAVTVDSRSFAPVYKGSDKPKADAQILGYDPTGVICVSGKTSRGNNLSYKWKILRGQCDFDYQVRDEVCCLNLEAPVIEFSLTIEDDIGQTSSDKISLTFGTYRKEGEPKSKSVIKALEKHAEAEAKAKAKGAAKSPKENKTIDATDKKETNKIEPKKAKAINADKITKKEAENARKAAEKAKKEAEKARKAEEKAKVKAAKEAEKKKKAEEKAKAKAAKKAKKANKKGKQGNQ